VIKRAVLFLATFALIAGCGSEEGGGDEAGDELAALAQAARTTSGIESYRYEMTMDSKTPTEALSMDVSGTSSADSTEGTLKGTMDLGEGDTKVEGIITDGRMYMRAEAFGLPKGQWIDTEDSPAQTMSPPEFVKFLHDSGDAEHVGTADVRGEPAQHFRGPVNLKELAEASPDSAFVEQMKNAPGIEDIKLILDIWVPDSGLPSRMAMDLTMPDGNGNVKMTSDILEYDVPVNAEAPPESDIADLSDLGG
jgi:hypothetical protein